MPLKLATNLIEIVKLFYPAVGCKNLEKELRVFYKRKEMNKAGLVNPLLYIEKRKIFNELTKLLSILVNIPMYTTKAE